MIILTMMMKNYPDKFLFAFINETFFEILKIMVYTVCVLVLSALRFNFCAASWLDLSLSIIKLTRKQLSSDDFEN